MTFNGHDIKDVRDPPRLVAADSGQRRSSWRFRYGEIRDVRLTIGKLSETETGRPFADTNDHEKLGRPWRKSTVPQHRNSVSIQPQVCWLRRSSRPAPPTRPACIPGTSSSKSMAGRRLICRTFMTNGAGCQSCHFQAAHQAAGQRVVRRPEDWRIARAIENRTSRWHGLPARSVA